MRTARTIDARCDQLVDDHGALDPVVAIEAANAVDARGALGRL